MSAHEPSRAAQTAAERLLFADFDLAPATGELRKAGLPVKLQPQPAKVLALLARHAGQVVTRDEIRCRVWGEETFVHFEQSLNFSIKQIRRALDDSATAPRFVETVPRRGYRFAAPVEIIPGAPVVPTTPENPESPEITAVEASRPASSGVEVEVEAVPALAPVPAAAVPPGARRHRLWSLVSATAALWLILILAVTIAQRRAPASQPRPKLAVLPFVAAEPMAGGDDALADGLTDEVITELARRYPSQLGVIARTSVAGYKGTAKPPRQIGRELDADYLLSGKVHRDGDRVRLAVRLVRADDEASLWAGDGEGVLGSELKRQVADGLAEALALAPERNVEATGANVSPMAYDAYLKGRSLAARGDSRQAAVAFEKAVELAPGFARAWAALAEEVSYTDERPERVVPRAMDAARRALELDPGSAEAHLAMGKIQLYWLFDWAAAGREFGRALELDPGLAIVHDRHAMYLASLGRFEEALAAMRRAQELDPVSLEISGNLAWHLYLARRWDEAIVQARRTLELDPGHGWARQILIQAATLAGDRETALAALAEQARAERWELVTPAPGPLSSPDGYWRWQLRRLDTLSRVRSFPAHERAIPLLALGDRERALTLLEQGCRERYGTMLVFLGVDPLFDPLRREERFERLRACVGVPEAPHGR